MPEQLVAAREKTAESHALFLEYLKESEYGMARIFFWLRRQGHTVMSPGGRYAPRHQDWRHFSDEGDLYVLFAGEDEFKRVEVKHIGKEFSADPSDWRPFKNFKVCSKHSWDNAAWKPDRFYVLSHSMRYAAIVMGSTQSRWFVVEGALDTRTGLTQDGYACDLDCVQFMELPDD